jgi:membrane protein implicated in regulation of membrane protease activity
MPEARYFARMGGAFLLGIFALAVAFILFVFLLPYLIPLALGTFLLAAVFVAVWAVVYGAIVAGVAIYYFVRHPMEWKREDKGYSISRAGESGMRSKGSSRKKK